VPVVARTGEVLGGLFLGHTAPGVFTDRHERLIVGVAAQAAVAIDNARLYAEVRDAARRKDEFLAMLAHELRNPLAPIRNALHILKARHLDPATVGRARDVLDRQVQHLVRLVDDLLDVSRLLRGKIELRPEGLELAALVARAVETAQPVLDARGHQLVVSLPPQPVRLQGDLVRLAQVINNLLTNAAKYTDRGGRITLTGGREGDQVVITVRDPGIGIAPELLPRIFDLFVQGDPLLVRNAGGLGIGLTLVKNLVELHGGTVTAASAGPGKGSAFTVRLPALPAGAEPEGPHGAAAEAAPCRVLVVDDNVDAAESLALLLQLLGHEVKVAHDGPTALELAPAFRPHLALLDIGMPGMDGLELARRLRPLSGLETTVLAALTGWGQEDDRRRTREAGFTYHLVKPADPQTLKELLAGVRARETPPPNPLP
jgi:signal transduction histidine kinase/CheY-like chemotaxis protein